MPEQITFVLDRWDKKKPKAEPETRVQEFPSWGAATKEVMKWAGSNDCRLAQVDPRLAAKLYPKIKIKK